MIAILHIVALHGDVLAHGTARQFIAAPEARERLLPGRLGRRVAGKRDPRNRRRYREHRNPDPRLPDEGRQDQGGSWNGRVRAQRPGATIPGAGLRGGRERGPELERVRSRTIAIRSAAGPQPSDWTADHPLGSGEAIGRSPWARTPGVGQAQAPVRKQRFLDSPGAEPNDIVGRPGIRVGTGAERAELDDRASSSGPCTPPPTLPAWRTRGAFMEPTRSPIVEPAADSQPFR